MHAGIEVNPSVKWATDNDDSDHWVSEVLTYDQFHMKCIG